MDDEGTVGRFHHLESYSDKIINEELNYRRGEVAQWSRRPHDFQI